MTRARLTVELYGGEDYHIYDGTRLVATVGCDADVRWLLDRDASVIAERDALKVQVDERCKALEKQASRERDDAVDEREGALMRIDDLKVQLADLTKERDALKEQLGESYAANYAWMSEHNELAARYDALDDAYQSLTCKLQLLSDDYTQLKISNERLRADRDAAYEARDNFDAGLESMRKERTALQREYSRVCDLVELEAGMVDDLTRKLAESEKAGSSE